MPVVVRLPRELRDELKAPMGRVYTDSERLLAAVDGPLIAVGDVVTRHLERAGRPPDVAVFDGRTERGPMDDPPATGSDTIVVENPPGTLTEELVVALRAAIDRTGAPRLEVDGEEDLAALPAVLAAPDGAGVVYGQPGEGMVLVRITPETRRRVRALVEQFDGDPGRLIDLVEG